MQIDQKYPHRQVANPANRALVAVAALALLLWGLGAKDEGVNACATRIERDWRRRRSISPFRIWQARDRSICFSIFGTDGPGLMTMQR